MAMRGSRGKTRGIRKIGNKRRALNFANKAIASVPHGRKGKHNLIVARILEDLERLEIERAVLVPLDGLNGEKMENVRSALNRATRQKNISVATSTDGQYFYVWRTDPKKFQAATTPDRLAPQITTTRQ